MRPLCEFCRAAAPRRPLDPLRLTNDSDYATATVRGAGGPAAYEPHYFDELRSKLTFRPSELTFRPYADDRDDPPPATRVEQPRDRSDRQVASGRKSLAGRRARLRRRISEVKRDVEADVRRLREAGAERRTEDRDTTSEDAGGGA